MNIWQILFGVFLIVVFVFLDLQPWLAPKPPCAKCVNATHGQPNKEVCDACREVHDVRNN